MRVTQSMIASQFLSNLRRTEERILRLQNELSTGSRVQRPSDDPISFNDIMRFQEIVDRNKKYLENIGEAKDWLSATEAALSSAGDVLSRARELAVQGANDTLPQPSRDALAKEIDQLRDQLIQVANTRFGDRYLFSGNLTETPSFDDNGVYQGNSGLFTRTIAAGIDLEINVPGNEVFEAAIQQLATLADDLRNGSASDVGSQIDALEQEIDRVLAKRADVGARLNRLELSEKSMMEMQMSTEELLSQLADTDVTKGITDLMMLQAQYQAALQVGARMMPPTLVDFLR